MMNTIQLVIWSVFGLLVTWGIFLAWVGFRSVPAYSKRRIARSAASFTFVVGVAWVLLWVSAIIYNLLQIFGGITWHLI